MQWREDMWRKKIAIFGCNYTSRYRHDFSRAFNTAADELGCDLFYFNSLGKIGNKNAQYGDNEFNLIEDIDLASFDGIIFDGEGYNVKGWLIRSSASSAMWSVP